MNKTFSCGGEESEAAAEDLTPFSSEREEEDDDETNRYGGYVCPFHVRFFFFLHLFPYSNGTAAAGGDLTGEKLQGFGRRC